MKNISITQVCYVRLGTSNLAESARFTKETVGLEPVGGSDGEAAFRSDSMYHRVCLTANSPIDKASG